MTAQTAGTVLAFGTITKANAAANDREGREYLRSTMPSRERVIQFTEVMPLEESMRRSNGWTYDPELGWVHCSAVHSNGVDNSKTFYHYETGGARRVTQFAGQPCRIHAYGNSFTHCDQVSDGETWEEYRQSKADIGPFLNRFYNGHHTPAGNFFTAWAIKDRVAKWLDPAPLPHRP